jgi:hypothetical protein
MSYVDFFFFFILSLEKQKYLSIEVCHHPNCPESVIKCNPHTQCLSEYHPICGSNLQEYSNECEMNKYACQSNINLTKLHDGPCDFLEQQRQFEGNRI